MIMMLFRFPLFSAMFCRRRYSDACVRISLGTSVLSLSRALGAQGGSSSSTAPDPTGTSEDLRVSLHNHDNSVLQAKFEERICGVCRYVEWTGNCTHFGACGLLDPRTCAATHCTAEAHAERSRRVLLDNPVRKSQQERDVVGSVSQTERVHSRSIESRRRILVNSSGGGIGPGLASWWHDTLVASSSSILSWLQSVFLDTDTGGGSPWWRTSQKQELTAEEDGSDDVSATKTTVSAERRRIDSDGVHDKQVKQDGLWNVRVTKAMASRGYNKLRVSVITKNASDLRIELLSKAGEGATARSATNEDVYYAGSSSLKTEVEPGTTIVGQSYASRFKWAWTQNYLHSEIVDRSRTDAVRVLMKNQGETKSGGRVTRAGLPRHGEEKTKAASISDEGRASFLGVDLPPLPAQGAGITGVFIADPCFVADSITTLIDCIYEPEFRLSQRTPTLLRTFVGSMPDVSYWGILGDNFYDRTGDATEWFFSQLDDATRSKVFLTVPGNHDYWVLGSPTVGTTFDQCGNGFVQYYGQDVVASVPDQLRGRTSRRSASERPRFEQVSSRLHDNWTNSSRSDAILPYNLSIDPTAGHPLYLGCNPTHADNTFFYTQMGNVLFVGYSALYSWESLRDRFVEACSFALAEKTVHTLFVLGHWNICNSGCNREHSLSMAVSDVAKRMVDTVPECQQFHYADLGLRADGDQSHQEPKNMAESEHGTPSWSATRGRPIDATATPRVRHIMGHVHCNVKNSDHRAGYMVAGWGMHGCGNFGLPIFDTTESRFRVYYFPLVDLRPGKRGFWYDAVMRCMQEKRSWRACAEDGHAELWTDEPLPPRSTSFETKDGSLLAAAESGLEIHE
ncbi:unnamed protein product [Amoebophrya sp. A120]|nr:unnamed protein product [Amoebophrya sp. A120]|eukprot:GSA120T00015241001.1